MYGSYLSLSKANSRNISVSDDLYPDLWVCLDPVQGFTEFFCEHSNIDPHTLSFKTQMLFVTPLSWDLEPDITKPNPWNISVSSDLAPDMSDHIDSGQVIARVFCEPFLLNSSWHDLKKLMKDENWAVKFGYLWREI